MNVHMYLCVHVCMYACKKLSANVAIIKIVILVFTFQMNDILVHFDYSYIIMCFHINYIKPQLMQVGKQPMPH